MKLYAAVTADKYELPIAIFDTLEEIAIWSGATKSAVLSAISHGSRNPRERNYRFIRFEIPARQKKKPKKYSSLAYETEESAPEPPCKTKGFRLEDYIVRC